MSGQANLRIVDTDDADPITAVRARAELVAALDERDRQRRARRVDALLQVACSALTLGALWLLTAEEGAYTRWGHVLGLASQPFWIAATWRAGQWGMLVVAIAMCGLWSRGIVNHFF